MVVRHVLITGGSGYIGGALVQAALARGLSVTSLARTANASHGRLRHVAWRLGEPVGDAAFAAGGDFPPVDAVVHLAHDWDDCGEPGVNVEGTRLLLEATRRYNLRVVLGSSVSARPDALNRYGRIKHAVESLLEPPRELVARIGMVYGGPPRGQWGMLCRIAALSPVLPMLEHRTPVQPIHLDDLCDGLLRLAAADIPARAVYGLADSRPLPFGETLVAIARYRHGRRLRLINIPLKLALAGVELAARVPGLPRIDRERLLGVAGLPVVDSEAGLTELGLVLRPLAEGLQPEPWRNRRALLAEGKVLLRYILGRMPPPWAVRRYVRALAGEGETRPLPLPGLVRRWPALLRAIEPVGGESPLVGRLALATLVAEATPAATVVFHDYAGRSPLAVLASLAMTVAIEGLCFPVRLLASLRRR